MSHAAQIPDDLLWAYVEGRLEARTCSAIERYLARHPALAREVRRMRQHQEILETADPRVLDEPVPERLAARANAFSPAAAGIGAGIPARATGNETRPRGAPRPGRGRGAGRLQGSRARFERAFHCSSLDAHRFQMEKSLRRTWERATGGPYAEHGDTRRAGGNTSGDSRDRGTTRRGVYP